MPIPVTSLDDRSFDDLVAEARARLQRHVPELTQIAEGDPAYALTDLMAWMAETVIYRANLIPERQRQAFLNLLQLPLRPATPASGVVCVDAKPWRKRLDLPKLLAAESAIEAGSVTFTTVGELQATPLQLHPMIKEKMDDKLLEQLGISSAHLQEIYNTRVASFRPRSFTAGTDPIDLSNSLDGKLYLLVSIPKAELADKADSLRHELAGKTINIGLAPLLDVPAELAGKTARRELSWEIAWQDQAGDSTSYFPLEVVDDSSRGGRESGVVRLRLPRSEKILKATFPDDPKQAGFGNRPPQPPADVTAQQVMFWLRLSAAKEPQLKLGWVGLNAVQVIGQGVRRDHMLGIGTGYPEQSFALPDTQVDTSTLQIEVSEHARFVAWQQVSHFADSGPESKVYLFDAASGVVQFGDGIRGKRPPAHSRIRAAYYRHGGGSDGNLPAGSLKQLAGNSTHYQVRHEWATQGGIDAETVGEAERRIPAHLSHRNRAVTADDFAELARSNPLNPVARAQAVPGLLPGASIATARADIPGVVSVFVLPPAPPALAAAPRPTAGLLEDVYDYLDQRKLVGTELYLLSPQFVPVALSVNVRVIDPAREQQTLNAIDTSLMVYLWALAPGGPDGSGWALGRDLSINELEAVVARVPGVLSVSGLRLFREDENASTWSETRQQLALRRYQLPELMEVATGVAGEAPGLPAIADPERPDSGATTPDGSTPVPAPVIPDLC